MARERQKKNKEEFYGFEGMIREDDKTCDIRFIAVFLCSFLFTFVI